jgi:hypothetical protein
MDLNPVSNGYISEESIAETFIHEMKPATVTDTNNNLKPQQQLQVMYTYVLQRQLKPRVIC